MLLVIIGAIAIISAYLLNITEIIPALPFGLIIPHYLFIIGFFLIVEKINLYLNKDSLLKRIKKKDYLGLKIFLIGTIIGILFEVYGVLISNLWYSYFQNWSLNEQMIHYLLGIIVGYSLPSLVYFDLYKIISFFMKKRNEKVRVMLPKKVGYFLFCVGIFSLMIPILMYKPSLSWNPILRGLLFSFCLLGIWLILEYFEIKKHENTFLNCLFTRRFKPLLIILVCSFIISISWEVLNKLRPSWIYQNMPLMEVTIFGLPLGLIIAWPTLFVIYFSFFNIISKKKERMW